jgi:hypothetical protein
MTLQTPVDVVVSAHIKRPCRTEEALYVNAARSAIGNDKFTRREAVGVERLVRSPLGV